VIPRFWASLFATLVSAARQPDSEPTCEKPTVMDSASAAPERLALMRVVKSKRFHMIIFPLMGFGCVGSNATKSWTILKQTFTTTLTKHNN
jgi:hypothetical protein